MDYNITLFSIVLVGSGFSPNVFNGNTFAENEIIPSEWNWKVTNSGSTPLVSQIDYNLGYFTVRTERNRISFFDNAIKDKPEKSKIIEVVKRFIDKYKHLNFLAVGINFESVLGMDDGDKHILDKFVSKAIKSDERIEAASVNLGYLIDENTSLRNLLEGGIIERQFADGTSNRHAGIVIRTNIHRLLLNDKQIEQIKVSLKNIKTDWNTLNDIVKTYIK